LVEITATGCSEDELSAAVESAFGAIEQVQLLMSFHDECSDVSRINRAGEGCDVTVHPLTYRVLSRAIELGDLSDGMFDIVTARVLVNRGFLPTLSSESLPLLGATYRDLELQSAHRVRWRRKGWLDLGGIAKGFAVDCAIAALQSHGASAAVVNAGGDLRCFGEQQQPIHVRRPNAPLQSIRLGWLSSAAIATSGGYFSGIRLDGQQFDPLVDPRQNEASRGRQHQRGRTRLHDGRRTDQNYSARTFMRVRIASSMGCASHCDR